LRHRFRHGRRLETDRRGDGIGRTIASGMMLA